MRIWITGAGGLVGQALLEALKHETLLPTYHRSGGPQVDLTDPDEVERFALTNLPDLVIHAAAMTDVDGCQREPEQAFKVNAEATAHIAEVCRRFDIPMAYLSTDFVFDGTRGRPYRETDEPHPLSVYGESKRQGELAVQSLKRYWIIRTQWVFGKDAGFPQKVLAAAKEGRPLRVVTDQIGSPTYAPDLSRAIAHLIGEGECGVYHLTNSGWCSKHELAVETLRQAGYENIPVEECRSEDFPTPAERPLFSVLENARWKEQGFTPLQDWREALQDSLTDS